MRAYLRIPLALARRAFNEIVRVPGGAIPGVLAPAIFLIGISGVFGSAARLRDFHTTDFHAWVLPISMLQGATFSGSAQGVNLARDIEQGWFDRLLLAPVPRPLLLAGIVASASLRALLPGLFVLAVGLALGVAPTGAAALLVAFVLVSGIAGVAACWGAVVALRFRTQQAAPLMQAVTFAALLFTTAYAPKSLLAPWLRHIVDLNPVTFVVDGVRQAFVGGFSWTTTWQAIVAWLALALVFGALALRGIERTGQ
jgi:ABC-type multidrug transport system permease subunit